MSKNLVESVDFYFDENGYMVLTEKYHISKGHCCGHGCKHCPYDFECVPEPKRSEMMKESREVRETESPQ